jgi:NHL repeat
VIVISNSRQPDDSEAAAPLALSPDPGAHSRGPASTVTGQRRRGSPRRLRMALVVAVAGLALAIGVAAPALAETNYVLERQWGSRGSGDGQFGNDFGQFIGGVATDGAGNVYASDPRNWRVQKFSSTGDFITKWGSPGTGDGQFGGDGQFSGGAGAVATDAAGNVYVADLAWGNHRIQKFTASGSFITKWGSSGAGDGQFDGIGGIATDAAGNVYVADNHRIQKFSSSGSFITKWSSFVPTTTAGVATDAAGNVYVAGYEGLISKFSSSGDFITQWRVSGHVGGVATDASGAVYATRASQSGSWFTTGVQKFSSSGSPITDWVITSYPCYGMGCVPVPDRVATDRFGSVYVALGVIRKYTPTQDPQPVPADRDGDGVPDDRDACPDQPGTGPDGCPPPPPNPPTADFTTSPSPSQAGQAVTFDWTGSCPAGQCTFAWVDEGPDGNGGSSSPLGNGDPLTFTFTGAGAKYIELTVTDSLGRSVVSPIRQHQVTAELRWSTDTDRAPSQPLDGATLPASAVCVFLDNDPAKQGPVRFHLDEPPDATPLRTDSNPPWDLAGGSVASCSRRKLTAGTHTVTAVEADGDRHTATFTRP